MNGKTFVDTWDVNDLDSLKQTIADRVSALVNQVVSSRAQELAHSIVYSNGDSDIDNAIKIKIDRSGGDNALSAYYEIEVSSPEVKTVIIERVLPQKSVIEPMQTQLDIDMED